MSEFLDRYGRGRSFAHRLPPLVKVALAVGVIVLGLCVSAVHWPLLGGLCCVMLMALASAGVSTAYVWRRLAVFLPMVVLLSISIPISVGLAAGFGIMTAILFRSTLSFLAGLWLVNVMPFEHLLVTLRRLWVPDLVIAVLAFMYRYVFVLWDELDTMRTARQARTFGAASTWFGWKTSAQLIGMLMLRALERAERVYGAMCARGWDGIVRRID